MRRPTTAWTDSALMALPVLLLAAVALPVRYTQALSEPDLAQMAAALVWGQLSDLQEAAGQHYGLSFSFGWYRALYAFTPPALLATADGAAAAINAWGLGAGALAAGACALYLRPLLGAPAAAASLSLFLLAPGQLPLMFSGHPLVAALAALFAGGALLNLPASPRSAANTVARVLAWGLLVGSLCLRAETVLAFPFVLLALPPESPGAGAGPGPLSRLARRALLLASAFAAFLVLQRPYLQPTTGALGSVTGFLAAFAALGHVGRGLGVLVLAWGWGSTLLALWLLPRTLREALRFGLWPADVRNGLGGCGIVMLSLLLPALVFWLPNPEPARHFTLAVLALSLYLGQGLQRALGGRWRALSVALLLVLANQGLAEALRPLLVQAYDWSYASPTARRATQQVPVGAFWFDQRANQAAAALDRQEALDLARKAPPRLLVLADKHYAVLAQQLTVHPQLRWREGHWHGMLVDELSAPGRQLVLVQTRPAWPRDGGAEVLAAEDWADWPVYVQASTRSRHDLTPVPEGRRWASGGP